MKVKELVVQLVLRFGDQWTGPHQDSLSMGFSRQEYWSGLPFCSPGDLPDPGMEPASLLPPALAGKFFTTQSPVYPPDWLALALGATRAPPQGLGSQLPVYVLKGSIENICAMFPRPPPHPPQSFFLSFPFLLFLQGGEMKPDAIRPGGKSQESLVCG